MLNFDHRRVGNIKCKRVAAPSIVISLINQLVTLESGGESSNL